MLTFSEAIEQIDWILSGRVPKAMKKRERRLLLRQIRNKLHEILHPPDETREGRRIHGMIFLGSETSEQQVDLLRARLEYGISLLSGLQQGIHRDSREGRQGTQALKDVVEDVAAALGFRIEHLDEVE